MFASCSILYLSGQIDNLYLTLLEVSWDFVTRVTIRVFTLFHHLKPNSVVSNHTHEKREAVKGPDPSTCTSSGNMSVARTISASLTSLQY